MANEWQTFVRQFDDMKEGDVEVFIKDLNPGPRKYNTRHVRARVRKAHPGISNGDILWIRSESGIKCQEPWAIEILEELPECVPGKPWEDVFEVVKRSGRSETSK